MGSTPPPSGSAHRLIRVGAVAAVAGGVAWAVKGLAILATGKQPPLAFELGPPLFATGLLGLYVALGREDGRARAGAMAAALALLLMLGAGVARAADPDLAPQGEEFTPLSAAYLGSALGVLVALVLMGLAGRRARSAGWASLALWMGVLVVPAMLAGGALSAIDERLLEIPLVLFAVAWIVLGSAMYRATPRTVVARHP